MAFTRISRLSLQLLAMDILLTPIGVFLGTWLRRTLPLGKGGALPEEAVSLPWYISLLAIVCWCGALVMNGAYEPQRVVRWYNKAMVVASSGTLRTILMAGGLYFGFREMSRLQFVYFYIITLGLLLGHRALLRVSYWLRGRAPGWRSRVLIIGAGDLGRRLATVLLDHSR